MLIFEIGLVVVVLCKYIFVVGVILGNVGCFGGMFIIVLFFSYFIMIKEVRFGFNGFEVIE